MRIEVLPEEGFRTAERFSENPFIDELNITIKERRVNVSKGKNVIDATTGEFFSTSTVTKVYEIDAEQFVKIYTAELSVWLDLSKAALRVFMALMKEVQSSSLGKGIVLFDASNKHAVEFKVSKGTYYRGLEELVAKRFIARSKTTALFFINPAVFFNGDRARFVREYRIKQKDTPALDSAV